MGPKKAAAKETKSSGRLSKRSSDSPARVPKGKKEKVEVPAKMTRTRSNASDKSKGKKETKQIKPEPKKIATPILKKSESKESKGTRQSKSVP